MFNYQRTVSYVFTVSSHSYIVRSGKCSSLLRDKFVKFGIVFQSSSKNQLFKLSSIIKKHGLIDFESVINGIPRSIWKEKSDFMTAYGFTIHNNTAKDIANTVMDSILRRKEMPVIVEWNPGFGLITEELLKRDIKNLVVYNTYPLQPLNDVLNKYKGKIEFYDQNHLYITPEFEVQKYFQFFEFMSTYKGKKTVVIGMTLNRIFFRRLIYYITNISYLCCNDVEFYITISYKIYKCLTSLLEQNSRVTDFGCFNHLFKVTVLKRYNRNYFLPLSDEENTDVFFVRLSRHIKILSQEDLVLYTNFLRIIGSRKSNYVIKEIEKWFPGLGPYLISKGITVTNQTAEFTAKELLRLFKLIQNKKGYDYGCLLMKNYDSNYFIEGESWT